ncbi:hypothetical protein Tco_0364146 [Tanacetum coccineum]
MDKLVEAFMSSLDKSSTTISDLYKGLIVITQFLKDISNVVKDDPATNQKLNEATETFARISSNVTEILSLVKGFNFFALLSTVKSIKDHVTALKREISSLRKDTFEIKSMITEMYAAFQGHPLAIPISSILSLVIPPTQAQPITSIIIHPKRSQATLKIDKGKGISTNSDDDLSNKLVKASSIVHPDPDEPDKEEQINKAKEEARLLAMTKLEVIKVVQEEDKKIGLDPKAIKGAKAGEMFKKAQDVEHAVLKRQHTKKVIKSLELKKHKLKKIPKELRIHFALPTPEQTPLQVSGRKWKHMELEPETRIPGLECNRARLENVPFVNNMVIEEPEYGILFTDEFCDQTFQRRSDIDKVGMEALVSYLVAASMVKSPENARFGMKLRKLIAEYTDQEKLKSKKVKLEALGYKMD